MWNFLKLIGGIVIAIGSIVFTFLVVIGALGIATLSILGVLIFVLVILLIVPVIVLFAKLTGKGSVTYSMGKTTYTYGNRDRTEVIDVEVEENEKDI